MTDAAGVTGPEFNVIRLGSSKAATTTSLIAGLVRKPPARD